MEHLMTNSEDDLDPFEILREIATDRGATPSIEARLDRTRREARRARGRRDTRNWRAREKAGLCLLRLEIDEAALVVRLVECGFLDPALADSRVAITQAVQQVLMLFCAGEVS